MYAGFWKRFAALIIDNILLNVLIYVVIFAAGYDLSGQTNPDISRLLIIFFAVAAICLLYWPLFESSPMQATPGKMALGIKVTDLHGGRIGFFRALGRNLGKIISGMTLNIGYAMAGFTVRKQALHDKMADCLVIDKNASAEDLTPLAPAKPWFICLAILATLAPYIIIFLTSAALIAFAMKAYSPSMNAGNVSYKSNVSSDKYAGEIRSAKDMSSLLSIISFFQKTYAEQNGGVYAEDFSQLKTAIPNFPDQYDTVGDFRISLGKSYITAKRRGEGDIPSYIITKCYKNENLCLYSEDLGFVSAAAGNFVYADSEVCCLD